MITVRRIIDEAAQSRYGPDEVLESYCGLVKKVLRTRQHLKRGVHKWKGTPLKPATLKYYQWELRGHQEDLKNYKSAIRIMAKRGMFEYRRRPIVMTCIEQPGKPTLRIIQGGRA